MRGIFVLSEVEVEDFEKGRFGNLSIAFCHAYALVHRDDRHFVWFVAWGGYIQNLSQILVARDIASKPTIERSEVRGPCGQKNVTAPQDEPNNEMLEE